MLALVKWADGSGFAVVDFEKGYVQFYEFYHQSYSIEKTEYVSW